MGGVRKMPRFLVANAARDILVLCGLEQLGIGKIKERANFCSHSTWYEPTTSFKNVKISEFTKQL